MPRAFPVSATRLLIALAAAIAAGCDDSTGPPVARMAVLSDTGVSDTVSASIPDPLVVRVRDEAGMPAFGVPVRFEVLRAPYPTPHVGAFLFATPERLWSSLVVVDTTDVNGEARVYLRLGTLAGPAQVAVDAPTLALSTTVTYTVLPGSPSRVRVAPEDSTMYPGHGYNLRGAVVD
jgi:hypothetical protein